MCVWSLSGSLIGSVVGFGNAVVIELGGIFHWNSSAVVLMLWPTSNLGAGFNDAKLMQSAFILVIEVGANVLAYALMFAAPVGLIVVIRRAFGGRRGGDGQ